MRVALFLIVLFVVAGPAALRAQRPFSDEDKEKTRVRIGMTREQQTQIDALWADTDRQSKEVNVRMGELRKQLQVLYDTYDYDRKQAEMVRREICSLHKRRSQIYADNQEKLRKILTRDQFDRLTIIVRERFDEIRRKWESHGRGPGRPGPPGPG